LKGELAGSRLLFRRSQPRTACSPFSSPLDRVTTPTDLHQG
jgi:hypothetical protein